jgi:hypothetical protein
MESQRSQIATHNPKVAGSSPAPATLRTTINSWSLILRSARCAQVLPPLLRDNQRPPGYPKQASLAVFDAKSLQKKEIFHEPATTRLLQYKSAEGLPPVTVSGSVPASPLFRTVTTRLSRDFDCFMRIVPCSVLS